MGSLKKQQFDLNKIIKVLGCILPKLLRNFMTYPINSDFLNYSQLLHCNLYSYNSQDV